MTFVHDEDPAPTVRFKRRKTAHSKRVYVAEEEQEVAPTAPGLQPRDAGTRVHDTTSPPSESQVEDDSILNLKDILRNRKRPRNRLKDVARKTETPRGELAADTSRDTQYTGRFVAQTGQIVDQDDTQMTKFVEARLAEQNFRQYGWPVPMHLQATVAEIAPDLRHGLMVTSSISATPAEAHNLAGIDQSTRMAAGMGKIEEVDIGPIAKRDDEKWKRLENGEFEQIATGKIRLGRDGKPRRPPKRRNSEDVRRDQLVEAVLSEARLDYFDAQAPTNSHAPSVGNNNDDAILAQFQAEYYESVEEARQQQRKAVPTSGVKGAKEAPKGPKLGGSKSARAKMRLVEEQAAKNKR